MLYFALYWIYQSGNLTLNINNYRIAIAVLAIVVVLLSHLGYRWIERPAMEMARKWQAKDRK